MHRFVTTRRAAPALLLLILTAGCGRGAQGLSLDKSVARESLAAALDAWKAGETPGSLKDRSPSIVVGDPDWNSGRRLEAYKLLPEETDDGTNLHATAELVLQDARAGRQTQRITYVVGTDPVITVFRR